MSIFAKAGKWLLEFPQGFGNAQGITTYLDVLDQGIERGQQLQEGQSPWVLEKGRKVLGYYSDLDGRCSRWGDDSRRVRAGKPDRLYVWLHGRNNGLTEASFINGFKNCRSFRIRLIRRTWANSRSIVTGAETTPITRREKSISSKGSRRCERRFKVDDGPHHSARLLARRGARRGISRCNIRIAGRRRRSARERIQAGWCMLRRRSRRTSRDRCTSRRTSSIGR